jgi:hypothetical protein
MLTKRFIGERRDLKFLLPGRWWMSLSLIEMQFRWKNDIFVSMKVAGIVFLLLVLTACPCPKHDIGQYPPNIELLFTYGNGPNEFKPDDSVFRIKWPIDSANFNTHTFTLQPSLNARTSFSIFQVPVAFVMIESLSSSYRDTVFDLKIKSRSKKIGHGRCSFNTADYFDIECTYDGQKFNNPNQGYMTLELKR